MPVPFIPTSTAAAWSAAGVIRRRLRRRTYPGGLDLSQDFHPVRFNGSVERGLTILGAPAEGVAFFQLSAARPRSNSSILNNVARWANRLVESLASGPVAASSPARDSGDCLSITTFRDRVRALLQSERARGAPRHIVILAIDGIPYELVASEWPNARMDELHSVFPVTSSMTAWLSSLTGGVSRVTESLEWSSKRSTES